LLTPFTTAPTFFTTQQPVRTIPNLAYYQASVESIDVKNGKVTCVDSFKTGHHFDLNYDALVVATGCETATFGVPGVIGNERVMFLKQLSDARAIRSRLIDCFERASSPACSAEEAKRLLTFVVVGGGPTSVEFTAELYDFLKGDVRRWYPDLHGLVNIYLVEASGNILGSFHKKLVTYVESLFHKRNIHVMTKTAVAKVDGNDVHLADGTVMSFGLMVWSTGIKQLQLIQSLDGVAKFPNGRLKVDDHLRLLGTAGSTPVTTSKVFAMGDCAGHESKPLPALAQVASQQGIYLAEALNQHGLEGLWSTHGTGFVYSHLGAMASVGEVRFLS
jgi:NADH dehydrogenase FAD-containing subunit